jgi:hypothetical protein
MRTGWTGLGLRGSDILSGGDDEDAGGSHVRRSCRAPATSRVAPLLRGAAGDRGCGDPAAAASSATSACASVRSAPVPPEGTSRRRAGRCAGRPAATARRSTRGSAAAPGAVPARRRVTRSKSPSNVTACSVHRRLAMIPAVDIGVASVTMASGGLTNTSVIGVTDIRRTLRAYLCNEGGRHGRHATDHLRSRVRG